MPLTNIYNLPEPIFRAIESDPYSIGTSDISVTQLIGPPQIRVLWKRHKDKIDVDVIERFWALCGQAMHVVLSRYVDENNHSGEKRMVASVAGWKLSGAMDLYNGKTKTLSDYKFVGQYSYKTAKAQMKPEWEAQLNIYRWLLRESERVQAEKLEIVCLLRDWMGSLVDKRKDYPPVPVAVLPVKVWDWDTVEAFVRNRVELHQLQEGLKDEHLENCTDEERWMRDGKPIRCFQFCPVRSVCHQHKEYLTSSK